MSAPEFGDKIYIIDTPLTRENGFAGERGVVYGFTTPSVTGVSFIGTSSQDKALNVHFDHRNAAFWFAPELVHLIDHNPGLIVGVPGKELIRRSDGGWDERPTATRPWWKFWA
jgi:hypothetical protein